MCGRAQLHFFLMKKLLAFRVGEKWADLYKAVGFLKIKGWDGSPSPRDSQWPKPIRNTLAQGSVTRQGHRWNKESIGEGVVRDWGMGALPCMKQTSQSKSDSGLILCSEEAAGGRGIFKNPSSQTSCSTFILNSFGMSLIRGGRWSFLKP